MTFLLTEGCGHRFSADPSIVNGIVLDETKRTISRSAAVRGSFPTTLQITAVLGGQPRGSVVTGTVLGRPGRRARWSRRAD